MKPKKRASFTILCLAVGTLLAGEPSSSPVFILLSPPKPDEVVAFANDMMMQYSTGEVFVAMPKENVLEFLKKGEIRPCDKENDKLIEIADLTLPEKIMNLPNVLAEKKGSQDVKGGRGYFNSLIRAEGVLVTKHGKIIFWKLWNDRVLRLRDETNGSCLLVLGETTIPASQYLKPFWDFTGADEPEKYLYGKLPCPKRADIFAFCNRPEGECPNEIRYPISKERIYKFLDHGTSDASLSAGGRISGLVIQPPHLSDSTKRNIEDAEMRGVSPKELAVADGVMATNDGRIMFWRLCSDFALKLIDEKHRTCMLRLGKVVEEAGEPWHVLFNVGSKTYESSITRNTVMRSPNWTPPQPPPLSSERAVQIAWQELSKIEKSKEMTAWRVHDIETATLYGTGYRKWYYKISLTKPADLEDTNILQGLAPAGCHGEAVIFVSMDGSPGKLIPR
ncbi:MAG: hypothetical protein WCH43_03425 [Verrucomicrobiota bacterium]